MAVLARRLAANVDGEFFVDSSCIDCDACRQIAPAIFEARDGYSAVVRQPQTDEDVLAAQKALVSCPTGSIGDAAKRPLGDAIAAYPDLVADNVYFCGFTSEDSFGAWSYLVVRPSGNVLIDSPRFTEQLARNIEQLGGVSLMLLTHRDDVADHAKFRERFGCERVLHRDDVTRATSSVERQPSGRERVRIDDDFVMIRSRDTREVTRCISIATRSSSRAITSPSSPRRGHLYAFRDACWYSWPEQIASMESMLDLRFEHVLPGHGRAAHASADEMSAQS